jgi:hypothetical protein
VSFLFESPNQGDGGFLGSGLKTSSYGLVIWASQSLRRFLSLGLKTKRTSICRLHYKTDRGRSAQDTRQDLASCATWKQVGLGFPSLAEAQRQGVHVVPSWRLRQSQVEDGRVDATGCIGPFYHTFVILNVLAPRGIVVI